MNTEEYLVVCLGEEANEIAQPSPKHYALG